MVALSNLLTTIVVAASVLTRCLSASVLADRADSINPLDSEMANLVILQKRADASQRNSCKAAFQSAANLMATATTTATTTTTTTTRVETTSTAPPAEPTRAPRPRTDPPPPPPSTGGSSFSQKCLNRMNYYRKLHNRPPFISSAKLVNSAQSWANNCAFEHNSNGQNMYSGDSSDCAPAVDMWYKEISLLKVNPVYISAVYKFAGHFTQIVSPVTIYAGCGVGCKTVCDFSPPGNVIGSWMSF
ncbi:hypothetical protein BASA81_014050 [Batrachochytrium salamandrivorans]|nr:hypothetical protein BASA81_014050 [Batrachochytrium salamandrivorans]